MDAKEPLNAQRWLGGVWEAVESLESLPNRAPHTLENEYVRFEVRQLVVGHKVLLFTVDDERSTVWIIGLRGSQLPRTDSLPSALT